MASFLPCVCALLNDASFEDSGSFEPARYASRLLCLSPPNESPEASPSRIRGCLKLVEQGSAVLAASCA
jgi:hypothetical protein